MNSRTQFSLFALLIILIAAFLGYRLWQLHPLYRNHDAIRASLTTVAEREGWLLSGVEMQTVTDDAVTLIYHDRRRGQDVQTCFILRLADNSLVSCADKR